MAEFVGETLPTVALSTGAVSNDFKYLCLTLNSTTRIQVVAVAYIEDRLLVALHYTAWHRRTASKRALPAFGKPCVVEVAWAQEEDRSQMQEQTLKLWMGFLTADLVAMVDEDGEDGEFSHVFSESGLEECYPSGNGLVAAAMEHFAFQSATEDIVQQVAAESGSHLLESRLGRLESLVGSLAAKLDSALGDPTPVVEAAPSRPSALRKGARQNVQQPHASFPSLDPSVVASALSAGVVASSLQEMQRLMEDPALKLKRLGEPMIPKSKVAASKKTRQVNVLSETDSEEEAGDGGGSGGATPSGSPAAPLEDAVGQLAQIVQILTADRVKKQKASKVEIALDGVSASGVTDSGTIGSGKKTATARRALRSALQDNPKEIVGLIEKLMLEDLSNQTITPGQPAPALCAKAWVEHRSRIGHWKSSPYTAWTVASALDALRAGNIQGCRARLNLMLLMLDQTACDRASWTLSSELSLEQPPPMSVLQTHNPPSIQDGELPFSKLLDPRWAEVAMSHVKDTEDYITRRSKLGRKDGGADQDPTPKPKPKPKVKGGAAQAAASSTDS